MKIKSIFVVAILISCVSGCARAPRGAVVISDRSELNTIQLAQSELLEKIKIGMSLSEFRQLVPEAYVSGQNNEITAYELAYEKKYVTRGDMERQRWIFGFGSPHARTYKQVIWFYFCQDRLVQWGKSNVWPQKPNIIDNDSLANPSKSQSHDEPTTTRQTVSADKTSKEAPVENLGRFSSQKEKCCICGKDIHKLEQHFKVDEKIICKECFAKLKSQN